LSALNKPIIAAISGAALGGGLELALGCHYRIAAPNAQLGLPEVQLGLLPGAGGTQRLPRLVGAQAALQMITTGAPANAKKALAIGLLDYVFPKVKTQSELLQAAIAYAKDTVNNGITVAERRVSAMKNLPTPLMLFDGARKMAAKSARGFVAPLGCVDAVEAAITAPTFEAGLKREGEIFAKLMMGTQSSAQQYFFFAQRECSKVPGINPKDVKNDGIKKVGIIGAGTMGAGIAMNFIQVGIAVILMDIKKEYVDNGLKTISNNYGSALKKKKLTKKDFDKYMSLVTPSTSYDDLKDVDMVIEAVFENMDIKKKVVKACDAVLKPGALICTNTSTLNVDEIADATSRPELVIGTHFFSPANQMKLLEIVRGKKTSPLTIAKVLGVGKRIKKVSVVVGNCFGFVGNRMIEWYAREAAFLLEEGASVEQVDSVLYKYGMAMGPFTMGDLAGNDVGYKIRESLGLTDPAKRKAGERYAGGLGDKLVKKGRLGQKTGKGWYKYEKGGRKPIPDPEVAAMIDSHRKELGIKPRKISDQEILERCLYPLINDGFNILQERIAIRPSDIDVIYVYGYGFPVYRGGPMFYADTVGLPKIVEGLEKYGKLHPNVSHWKVSPFLKMLVDQKMTLMQFVEQAAKQQKKKSSL
jgi:3-hydroxyacyl-CoA dehydrogenase